VQNKVAKDVQNKIAKDVQNRIVIPKTARAKARGQKQKFGTTMYFPEGLEKTPFKFAELVVFLPF